MANINSLSNMDRTLTTDGVITTLTSVLAPLNAFSTKFSTDTIAPRATIIVPLATSANDTMTNPADFESGSVSLTGQNVVVDQLVQSWQVNDEDCQKGISFSQLDEINVKTFANKINDLVLATITTASFATASCNLTVSASNFSTTELKSLRKDVADYDVKTVVLSGECYSNFIGVNLQSYKLEQGSAIYGFDGFYENNRLDKCGIPCDGFVCSPTAIAIASGLPKVPNNNLIQASETITLPKLGLSVLLETWFSTKTRTMWKSLRVMLGVAAGDTNALRYFIGK
jgi:hypothetical protein